MSTVASERCLTLYFQFLTCEKWVNCLQIVPSLIVLKSIHQCPSFMKLPTRCDLALQQKWTWQNTFLFRFARSFLTKLSRGLKRLVSFSCASKAKLLINNQVDVVNWMTRIALELIGQSGLGYSFDELTESSVPHEYGLAAKQLV